MFENKDNLIESLSNPMKIASMTLTEVENRLSGTKVIADPNSPFCHLLEFGSSVVSEAINGVHECISALYPYRAVTAEDLYHHMSDYDYLKMYSTPSFTTLRLGYPKQYLVDNALPVGGEGYETYVNGEYIKDRTDYKKLTIPKDTVFMIGKYPFGIYYPIDILIRNSDSKNLSKTFSVVYDTHYRTPLHTLSKNVVDKYDITYMGLEYLLIDVPIYQFAKSIVEDSLISATGFAKKYTYNNEFYAVRIFSYKDGVYTELDQTQSYLVYDSETPTAMVNVYPDDRKFSVVIPQIYFDSGLLGTKLYMEVYTTLGELDINTANIDLSNVGINYGTSSKDSTKYSYIFNSIPFDHPIQFAPDATKITGGTSVVDISTLRQRIIRDTLYDKVPITEADLSDRLSEYGFSISKYLDNVTDRIYYAYHAIEDGNGSTIPSATIPLKLKYEYCNEEDDEHRITFIEHSVGNITILPTTIYKYDSDTDTVSPIDNKIYSAIPYMEKQDLADLLNSDKYYKTPYHIKLSLNDVRPYAEYFDLMRPSISKMLFKAENYNTASKMIAFDAAVEHLLDGTGGYKVFISVYISDDLRKAINTRVEQDNITFAEAIQQDILINVLVQTKDGRWLQNACTYEGENDTNTRSIFSFRIQTKYDLGTEGCISIDNFMYEDQIYQSYIDLEADFYLVYMTRRALLNYGNPPYEVIEGCTETVKNLFCGITRQQVTVKMGNSLSDVLHTNMEVSAQSAQYDVYTQNIQDKYENVDYLTGTNGKLELVEYYIDDEGNFHHLIKDESNNTYYTYIYSLDTETDKFVATREDVDVENKNIKLSLIKAHVAGEGKEKEQYKQIVKANTDISKVTIIANEKQWYNLATTYKRKIDELTNTNNTYISNIENLNNNIQTLRNEINMLGYEEGTEEYSTRMTSINAMEAEIEVIRTRINENEVILEEYTTKNKKYEEMILKYKNEIENDLHGFYVEYEIMENYTDIDTKSYLHKVGDIILGNDGKPTFTTREKIYYVDLLLIDSKIFVSEKQSDLEFQSNIYEYLEKYFAQIRAVQADMLEQTFLYFKCINSSGQAVFNLGNGSKRKENVEMTFNLYCYVPSYVKSDVDIKNTIYNNICNTIDSVIKTKNISMLDIFNDVKSKMNDYVEYFSLLGVNGDITNQTFIIEDDDAQPSIKRQLVVNSDNLLVLEKQVTIDFKALEDNTANTLAVQV